MRLIDADVLRTSIEKDRDASDMPKMWYEGIAYAINHIIHAPTADAVETPMWIPVTERLPIKEFEDGRKNKTVYDIYPCLVTRYSTHTDIPRTRTYVCKSYFDGEDFMLHGGYAPDEGSDTENTLAWMPLPEPYREEEDDD